MSREEWLRERMEWSTKGRDKSCCDWLEKMSGMRARQSDKSHNDSTEAAVAIGLGSAVGTAVGSALGFGGLLALLGIAVLGSAPSNTE